MAATAKWTAPDLRLFDASVPRQREHMRVSLIASHVEGCVTETPVWGYCAAHGAPGGVQVDMLRNITVSPYRLLTVGKI